MLSSNKIINLLNEWQLKVVLSTKMSSWKNIVTFLSWIKRFHGVSLLRYSKEVKWKRFLQLFFLNILMFFIYGEFYTKHYKTIFCTITCKYMSPKCWNGADYMTRKWTCIFVLNVKLNAVNAGAIWMPKHKYSQKWFLSNSVFLQLHLTLLIGSF